MATRILYCHCYRDKQREILAINRSLMRSREGSHQQNGMISMCVCVWSNDVTIVSNPSEISVLVPGAGLGRLAWEIAHLGMSLCVSHCVISSVSVSPQGTNVRVMSLACSCCSAPTSYSMSEQ